MAELFVIGIGLFLFVLLGTIYVATQRYKLAPSDQILVVYGNVKDKQSAECIHGAPCQASRQPRGIGRKLCSGDRISRPEPNDDAGNERRRCRV